ncbi:cardiolipin synthase [Lampropedia aestuarii]|uniref:Cardiolipin synthase n=1 Tax=Lampropedia aestuarii TaxID=2562762 RepID=A0A4S5BX89_9BURK|nr:cardiolipin synthase [Lampropedia aestuarii]MDH5855974.1 cardiolipin synthase [Lampropedia aestuarii]THJ35665.1 cardiolipin synthase [Lampropedia aestuarii]
MPIDWTDSLIAFLAFAWGVYVVVLGIWVLLQKRPPEATISWILVLGLLPYVGFFIFYFLGPQRLRKQQSKRLSNRVAMHVSDDLQALKDRAAEAPQVLRQLAQLGTSTTGIYPCTGLAVDLLTSGAETFDAIERAIFQARHHVHLEYYIYEPDHTGTRIRDALIQKAYQGVQVRLLVDALGSKKLSKAFLQPLLDAGVEFARFHDTRFGRRWRPVINYRSHRKIVVCDGRVAFTGGVNVTDEEDTRVRPDAYHDVHVRLEGNPAFWLQMVFLEDWAYANHMPLAACVAHVQDYLPVSETGPFDVQVLTSGPNNPAEPIHRTYVQAIHAARSRVLLTTPYFVPSETAMMALTNAALAGIDVHVLVPERSDSLMVTLAARSYYDELVAAGVKVWEYKAGMLHSKTLVIDDNFGFIGTANFDLRSFRLNYEVGVAVMGSHFNEALSAQFQRDLRHSRRVPSHRHIPFWPRLAEAVMRLFSPML